MKQLTLNLKKKILIVESVDNLEGAEFYQEKPIKLICKGSELTEEVAKEYVEGMYSDFYLTQTNISQLYKSSLATYVGSALKAFKERLKKQGYYWGENPLGDYSNALKRHILTGIWQGKEDKTFKLDKTLIFEIL